MVHAFNLGTSTNIPAIIVNSSPPPSLQQSKYVAKELPIEHQPQSNHLQHSYSNKRVKTNNAELSWNPSENGQWVWMPNQEQTIEKIPYSQPTTTATTINPEKWKWNNYNEIYHKPLTSETPLSYDTPVKTYHHHHHSAVVPSRDHPYSFDSIASTEASSSTIPSVFVYETSSDEEERYKHENRFHYHSPPQGLSTTSVPVDWSQYLSVNNNNGRDHELVSQRAK